MTDKANNLIAVRRLTALWALCESGLGGWMHALKIPLTGFLVGGFAVVIISLLAHYSRNNFRIMMQATALVLLVKFTVSPHSPGPAYLAVSFQGLMGALLYRLIPNFTIASVLFAMIAMLESAVQKLLVMTLIFGKSLWVALDGLYNSINKDFGDPNTPSFSIWVIGIYTAVYTIWGLLIGLWIARLPHRIESQSEAIRSQFKIWNVNNTIDPATEKRRQKNKLIFLLLILAMIATVFLTTSVTNGTEQANYVIVRTLLVLLLLFGVVNPLLKWVLQRWAVNRKDKAELQSILNMLHELRSYVAPSYRIAKAQHSGLKRYTTFLLTLIVITLQPTADEHT